MKKLLKTIRNICMLVAILGISGLISCVVTNQFEVPTTLVKTATSEALEEDKTDHKSQDTGTFIVKDYRPLTENEYDHYNRPITQNGAKDEVYCISPGTRLSVTGNSKEYLQSLTGSYSINHLIPTDHATDPPHKTRNTGKNRHLYGGYKFSDGYYYCSGDHVTQNSIIKNIYTGQNVNTYDVAYIVSHYPVGIVDYQNVELDIDNWADFKQYAVWKSSLAVKKISSSRIESIRKKDPSIISNGENLIKQSKVYQDMTEGIKATTYTNEKYTTKDGEVKTYQKEADSMVIPHTQEELEELQDNMKVDTDLDSNMYKAGPFTLNYVYGFNSEIKALTEEQKNDPNVKSVPVSQYSMSGISDMYLAYEDKNGNEQRINIDMFIRPTYSSKYAANQSKTNPKAGLGTGGDYGTPKFWSNYSLTGDVNLNKIDLWCYDAFRNYPAPNEEFYVEFSYKGELPASLKLKVEYKYLSIDFLACRRKGTTYYLYESYHNDKACRRKCSITGCRHVHGNCTVGVSMSSENTSQPLTYVDYYREIITNKYEIPFKTIGATSMKVGGYVFEDYPQGKEEKANGVKDSSDLVLPNVEVALYVADENGNIKLDKNGKEMLADLYTLEEEYPDLTDAELEAIRLSDDYKRRINPTLTDAYGYYEFRGVKQGQKYIVKFSYNGHTYMPTEYLTNTSSGYSYTSVAEMVKAGVYDSKNPYFQRWRETSKGLEKAIERQEFTERFKEIGSSPRNYKSTNSLNTGALIGDNNEYYNNTYSEYELLGFKLQKNGEYLEEGKRLVDSYLTIKDGKIVDTSKIVNDDGTATSNPDIQIQEGLISKKVKEYIKKYNKYPTDFKTQIYQEIVDEIGGDKDKTWKMLQYIEDCKMYSYTLNNIEDTSSYDLYPVYNQYTTFVEAGNKYPNNSYTYDDNERDDNLYNGTMKESESIYGEHRLAHNSYGIFTDVKWEQSSTSRPGKSPTIMIPVSEPGKWTMKWPGEAFIDDSQYYGIGTRNNDKEAIIYKNIYPGQLYVNQGLWRRQEVDLALEKDIYKATVKINGKTEVYDYDSYGHGVITPSEISALKKKYTHNGVFDEAGFKEALNKLFTDTARERWDIHLRMADYANYYEPVHNRAIYRADYEYVSQPGRTGAPLDVYITYKISVKNQSQTILGQVLEVVDYYDEDFEYMEDLSWVTYEDGIIGDKDKAENTGDDKGANYISSEDYYNMMDNIENGATADEIKNAKDIKSSNRTKYDRDTESDITERTITDGNTGLRANYDAVYVKGLEDKKLAAGEKAYIYLTFKIKTDGSGKVIINESKNDDDEDKMNFAEINGYTTFYKDNTLLPNYGTVGSNDPAGLVDIDSKPGNLEADDLEEERYESNFEDDTDRAKALHIYVDDEAERKLNGVVWEDQRNVTVDGATIGDGIRQKNENTVNNIWVELYEIELDNKGNPIKEADGSYKLKDGVVQIYEGGKWTSANENTTGKGNYEFTGFIPGDYIVRFNYGNEHNATYNGQDFKSTTYQVGIDQSGKTDAYTDTNKEGRYDGYRDVEKQNETGLYGYDIAKADQDENNYSDAKDIWSRREQINNYSNNNGKGVTNELAYTLSQHTTPNPNTEMKAETGAIVAEVEYNRQNSNSSSNVEGESDRGDNNYNSNSDELYADGNDINTEYSLNNVDFGLVERPKAQLELNKKVTNVRLTLANGQIIVDSTTQGPYLSWVNGKAYNIISKRTEQKDTIYETDYSKKKDGERYKDDKGGHGTEYYEYRKELITDKFTSQASGKGYNGLIQINMDEELMHGATIRIEYTLTVTNAGEIDFDGKGFYYRADDQNNEQEKKGRLVTTSADQVIDYVNNNLQFRAEDNKEDGGSPVWSIISTDEVINGQNGEGSKLVNSTVAGVIKKNVGGRDVNQYNSIVQTETLKKALVPQTKNSNSADTSISTKLVLSQLITAQNDTDDLTYDNIAEIVKTTNSVGRRMAYSVAGNQDPTQIPSEVDAAKAERVMILPPFGSATYVYIIIAIAAATILVVGIVLIKKKVIGKKE